MNQVRVEYTQCGMCQNRCHVIFFLDEFGLVSRARKQLFTASGEELLKCPNLVRAEGKNLSNALRFIAIGLTPKYIPTGGH